MRYRRMPGLKMPRPLIPPIPPSPRLTAEQIIRASEKILVAGWCNQHIAEVMGLPIERVKALRQKLTGRFNGAFGKAGIRWMLPRFSLEMIHKFSGLSLPEIKAIRKASPQSIEFKTSGH